ncbi:hypothetical protein [Gellertiella hungarica]|uniref:DUF2846 domain-containing protein n=1 Tax=Gellertiella hungarica TaxID=1572859 RepID=A0A7W6J3U9_9HYPH|nr:hypothetical protein [Gellertiella hungarica]MBB4064286.1 hypothetical protein [Gellertiella hungarica]
MTAKTFRFRPALVALALGLAAAAPAFAAYELYPGERLQGIAVPLKGPLTLSGWTREGRGIVYSLPVKAGESFRFRFKPRNNFVGLVVFDEQGEDEEELFSVQGTEADKVLKAETDTSWIIRPYYARMSPRRGPGAPYSIEIIPE